MSSCPSTSAVAAWAEVMAAATVEVATVVATAEVRAEVAKVVAAKDEADSGVVDWAAVGLVAAEA